LDACTVIAKNYLAHARVLAESFRRHHPAGRFSVLVVDEPEPFVDAAEEPFELLTVDSLDLPEYERMAAIYDVVELSTAVKPWLLEFLLDRAGSGSITYLDPDTQVFASLEDVSTAAERHGLVLTPHITRPLPRDGSKPGEREILAAGAYNLGFLALGNTGASKELLRWWAEHLRNDCLNDPARGLFVDQRWIDLMPGIAPDHLILRDPGCNVAYWNLGTRAVERTDSGRYLVDGQPLRLFHFSGFDPLRPQELSKHQNRVDLRDHPALAELCSAYGAALLAHGHEETRRWPYTWAYLPNGSALDVHARRLYRQGLIEGRLKAPLFSRRGSRALLKFLQEPTTLAGREAGVTRYLREIYDSRPDLQAAFPNLDGEDAFRFLGWARDWVHSPDDGAAVASSGSQAPEASKSDEPEENSSKIAPRSEPSRRPWGVNVAGYLTAELGIGEAARQIVSALDGSGVPTAPLNLRVNSSRMGHDFHHLDASEGPFAVNLVCVNADTLSLFAEEVGSEFFVDRYTIGMWFWEVAGPFPDRLRPSFDHLDEVWAASRHVADAIAPASPIPVHRVRLPVEPTPPAPRDRSELGLPSDFVFLFMFDYNSVFRRKNPLGLVESFRYAFPVGSGASLVLKSINEDKHPEESTRLRAAVERSSNVHLIEGYVSAAEKSALVANCDCYVSLHRSEGFGLTLAEAMYFGRPTIATGYSGNLEFMNEANSYLVEYSLKRVGEGGSPYPADAEWAEPDLAHAAGLMREVFGDPAAAAARGRRAAESIRESHSARAAGAVISDRIERIRSRPQGPSGRRDEHAAVQGQRGTRRKGSPDGGGIVLTGAPGLSRVRGALAHSEPPAKEGTGRLRLALRRLLFRLLRPFTVNQRRVDTGFLEAIEEIERRIASLQSPGSDPGRAAILAALRAQQKELESFRAEVQAALGSLPSVDAADDRAAPEPAPRADARTALDEVGR